MCYNETSRLIKKYDKQYVPGERPNKTTQKQNRNTRKLLQRLETLNELENELPFTLNNQQKAQVEHLIRRFNNKFKKLHGNASEKTIILAFIFIIKRIEHPKYTIDRFVVCRENGLNHNIYETIHSRITEELLKIQPLNNTRTYNYNNEILYHTHTPLTN